MILPQGNREELETNGPLQADGACGHFAVQDKKFSTFELQSYLAFELPGLKDKKFIDLRLEEEFG